MNYYYRGTRKKSDSVISLKIHLSHERKKHIRNYAFTKIFAFSFAEITAQKFFNLYIPFTCYSSGSRIFFSVYFRKYIVMLSARRFHSFSAWQLCNYTKRNGKKYSSSFTSMLEIAYAFCYSFTNCKQMWVFEQERERVKEKKRIISVVSQ